MEIDCDYTDFITCPYCGSIIKDSWEYGDSDTIDCDDCNNKFWFEAEHSVTYSSFKIENPEDWKIVEMSDMLLSTTVSIKDYEKLVADSRKLQLLQLKEK